MHKNTVRIIAIALAALMLIGVIAGAVLNSFALEKCVTTFPSLGERSKIVPISIAVVATLTAAACFVVPKLKNSSDISQNNDAEN